MTASFLFFPGMITPLMRVNGTAVSYVQLAAQVCPPPTAVPPNVLQWMHRLAGQSASVSQAKRILGPASHTP